jgi:acetoin utilization deacetylase AcuC-like enzyme
MCALLGAVAVPQSSSVLTVTTDRVACAPMAARLVVHWHPAVLEHDTGSGLWETPDSGLLAVPENHPENADRVANMRSVLANGPLARHLEWREGRLATEDELATVHDPGHIAAIREACESGGRCLGATTTLSARSWEPVLAAAGTSLAAADAVIAGEAQIAYALVRPPGHHAAPARADGYCFFNHAALMAERFRAAGAERVAIFDWDVHHGNGTQACFYERADVLTISLHMRHGSWGPSHPETGSAAEAGLGPGAGHNVNIELRPGSGDGAYGEALRRVVEPVLARYRPDVLIAASGQDASTFDANGRMNLSMEGFHRIGERVRASAEDSGAALALVQEGGYARTYAAYCLHATLEGVLGTGRLLADPIAYLPDDPAHATADIDAVCAHHGRRWGIA